MHSWVTGKGVKPATPTQPSIKRYDWTVHYTKAAPDCFEKNVVYVNHQFQPTIRVTRGQILEVVAWPAELGCCIWYAWRRSLKTYLMSVQG